MFTPDRLAVVKGGPAARRAYFDRVVGRLFRPARRFPAEYAPASGSGTRRSGASRRPVVAGRARTRGRCRWPSWAPRSSPRATEAIALLAPAFAERAGELGLPEAALAYEPEPVTVERSRRGSSATSSAASPGRARTCDDVSILSGGRDLRLFGSQGEQRLAVLVAAARRGGAVAERRGVPPLLLLDDVLSELDASRRRTLGERIGALGQTIVTATGADALPLRPAQLARGDAGRGAGS